MKLYPSLLLFAVVANTSMAQDKKDVLLVVDKNISALNGAPYPMPIEKAFALASEDGSEAQIFLTSEQLEGTGSKFIRSEPNYGPVMSLPNMPNYGYGAALGGGLIAAGIIETKIMMDRQKPLKPLREFLNGGALRSRFLSSAKQAISMYGFNVQETIIMENVHEDRFKTIEKNSGLRHLIMFRKVTQLPITISGNNTTPIFVANISYYVKENIRFKKQYDADIIFIGRAAPNPATSVQYWSNNSAEKFLAEVDVGIQAMFNHVLTVGPGSPDDKAKKELLKAAAKDGSDKVVMLKSENNFAYGMVENSYYLIAPIEKSALAPANASPPAIEKSADSLKTQVPADTAVSVKE